MPEIKYEITGDASKLEGAAREAESALKAMDRAADGASKSIDKAGRGADGAGKNLHGLKKLAQGAGFGQIAGDMEDIGEGMMSLGPAGAAAAGGLLAIGASAVGTYKVIDALYEMSLALDETDKKLADYYQKGLPGFSRASDEALKASSGLSESSQLLGDMMSQAGVIIASRVAPAFDELARITAVAGFAALDALDAYEKWWDTVKESIGTTYDAVTAGSAFREDIDATTGATNEHRKTIDKLIADKQRLADMEAINGPLQEKAVALTKAKNEADAESDRLAKKRIADAERRARTEEQLQDTLNGMFTEFLDPLEKIDEKYDELGDKVKKLGGSESDLAQVEMARHLAKMAYIEDEAAAVVESAARTAETAAAPAAPEQEEAVEKSRVAWEDMFGDVAGTAGDLLDARIDHQTEKHEAAKREQLALEEKGETVLAQLAAKRAADEGKKLEKMAKFRKKAAIMEALIQTALAVARGAPDPVSMILGGIAGGIAVATAAGAQVPKYHTGGIAADEMTVRKNESLAVMTRQGQKALGPHGLAKINRGEAAPQSITVRQVYGHKGFGSFTEDNLEMSGSPLRKAIKGDRRVGHRVRR